MGSLDRAGRGRLRVVSGYGEGPERNWGSGVTSVRVRWGVAALFGVAVSLGSVAPSAGVSDLFFPSDLEMRDTIGLRTDRYEFPPRNVMGSANGYRNTKCAPRYARQAVSVGAWSYNLLNGPHGGSVGVTVWEYYDDGDALQAVNNYRRQMAGCKSYRLFLKKVRNDEGFPVKTRSVTGAPGQARMLNKYGAVVDSAEREWFTAVDRYVVQVEVAYWGQVRPPFPPAGMARDVTSLMETRLLDG